MDDPRKRQAVPTYQRNPPRPLPDGRAAREGALAAARATAQACRSASEQKERRAALLRRTAVGLRLAGIVSAAIVTSLLTGGVAVPAWLIGLSAGLGAVGSFLGAPEGRLIGGSREPTSYDLPPAAR